MLISVFAHSKYYKKSLVCSSKELQHLKTATLCWLDILRLNRNSPRMNSLQNTVFTPR
jgi:hypothetical protein